MATTRFYESTKLPDLKGIDLLIVIGSSMNVNDENEFPWLIEEAVLLSIKTTDIVRGGVWGRRPYTLSEPTSLVNKI
jgi:hypothetical protein